MWPLTMNSQCLTISLTDVEICPISFLSSGIGYASIVIVSLLNIYYIVILAWGLYYLFQCFQPELPWAKCNQPWNTKYCVEDTVRKNKTYWLAANITNFTSPVTEFWEWVNLYSMLHWHTFTWICLNRHISCRRHSLLWVLLFFCQFTINFICTVPFKCQMQLKVWLRLSKLKRKSTCFYAHLLCYTFKHDNSSQQCLCSITSLKAPASKRF